MGSIPAFRPALIDPLPCPRISCDKQKLSIIISLPYSNATKKKGQFLSLRSPV